MPIEGDKVGDGYVEIHEHIDEKSLKKTDAALDKATKERDRKAADAAKKRGEDQLKALRSNIAAQGSLENQKQRALDANFQKNLDSVNRVAALKRKEEERSYKEFERGIEKRNKLVADANKKRLAAEKEISDFMAKAEREFQRGRKSGGNGNRGSNNRGTGILGGAGNFARNVSSILPGQLEKVFENKAFAAAGVALGTHLIGAAAGALATAANVGVLGGGIALAISKDPELQRAGKLLGNQLLSGFQDAANDTLAPAIKAAFKQLEGQNFAGGLANSFRDDFARLAPSLVPLTSDITVGLNNIADAFDAITQHGGEFISQFGSMFKQLTKSAKDLFQGLDDNRHGIILLLQDVTNVASGIFKLLGGIVTIAAKARDSLDRLFNGDNRSFGEKLGSDKELSGTIALYQKAADGAKAYRDQLVASGASADKVASADKALAAVQANLNPLLAEQTARWNQSRAAGLDAAAANHEISASDKEISAAEAEKKAALDKATAAIQDQIDKTRALSDATYQGQRDAIAYAQAQTDIKEAFRGSNDSISLATKRGRELRSALVEQFHAAREQAQAVYEQTGSADKANKKFRDLTSQTISLTGATGKNKTEIVKLRDAYADFRNLPKIEKTIDVTVQSNIKDVLADIGKLPAAKRLAEAQSAIQKAGGRTGGLQKASGGMIHGPGSGTSDSIPAMLSNGEFVIKASSVRTIGASTLSAMNATGQAPVHRARGGVVGYAKGGFVPRSKTGSQVAQYNALVRQMAALTTTIATQTASLNKWTASFDEAKSQFASFVNLGTLDTQGKSAGDILTQLQSKKKKAGDFANQLQKLKAMGLGGTALEQLAQAGPDSDIASILSGGIGAIDVGLINGLLGGASDYGSSLATTIGGNKPSAAVIAANKRKLAAKQKKAAGLKAPRAKGATIKYVNGKPQAYFSKSEIASQALKTGQYVTVLIDGKEVRAIVKQEQTKATAKTNRKIKSGRR